MPEQLYIPKYYVHVWRIEVENPADLENYFPCPFNSVVFVRAQSDPPTDPPSGNVLAQKRATNGNGVELTVGCDGGRTDLCYAQYISEVFVDPWPWKLISDISSWTAPENTTEVDMIIRYRLA